MRQKLFACAYVLEYLSGDARAPTSALRLCFCRSADEFKAVAENEMQRMAASGGYEEIRFTEYAMKEVPALAWVNLPNASYCSSDYHPAEGNSEWSTQSPSPTGSPSPSPSPEPPRRDDSRIYDPNTMRFCSPSCCVDAEDYLQLNGEMREEVREYLAARGAAGFSGSGAAGAGGSLAAIVEKPQAARPRITKRFDSVIKKFN